MVEVSHPAKEEEELLVAVHLEEKGEEEKDLVEKGHREEVVVMGHLLKEEKAAVMEMVHLEGKEGEEMESLEVESLTGVVEMEMVDQMV